MTFTLFIRKAAYKAYRLGRNALFRFKDSLLTSYGGLPPKTGALRAFPIPLSHSAPSTVQQAALDTLLAHEFNFLGSGPFRPDLAAGQPSAINPANRQNASRIASLLSPDYSRIDWHGDPKSGHHWQPDTWQGAITYGSAGEEILLPWTLSRMQHLPFLAKCWMTSADTTQKEEIMAEFQNQILDFCAANPPRWGVNWASPMDVSIRAINWLVAYDLLIAGGADFAPSFLTAFKSSLMDHGRFIYQFREWHPVLRNNHYLSDLAGLIFITGHLPENALTQRWLAFSAEAFLQEIFAQFHPDGSNFEASTCYHMLSSELALLGLTVLFSLPLAERQVLQNVFQSAQSDVLFPHKLFELVKNIQLFITDTLSAEGEALQIGDNDSSRILKLQTAFWTGNKPESPRNFQPLQRQIDAFLAHYDQWNTLASPASQKTPLATLIRSGVDDKYQLTPHKHHPSAWVAYPGLGLYLYRNELYRLSVRCGPVGQSGIGGHAHNDQLSITLHIQNQPVIVDPGSYCYTSDPQTRMVYRSTAYHNTLAITGQEQNLISPPEKMIFRMLNRSEASGHMEGPQTFTGRQLGYGSPHTRTLQTFPDRVEIQDSLDLNTEKELHFHLSPWVESVSRLAKNNWIITCSEFTLTLRMEGVGRSALRPYNYSPEYGQLQETKELVFITEAQDIRCTLAITEK